MCVCGLAGVGVWTSWGGCVWTSWDECVWTSRGGVCVD